MQQPMPIPERNEVTKKPLHPENVTTLNYITKTIPTTEVKQGAALWK
jgi:hypothetical protein